MSRRSHLDDEGVTRYQLDFKKGAALPYRYVQDVNVWRSLLHRWKWIGQAPARYRGVGFGNVSQRSPRHKSQFIISGTQTGRIPTLSAQHYALVLSSDPIKNYVRATGPVAPSSESMTHAVIYSMDSKCQAVIHVHSPLLWKNARRLGIPLTSRHVPYGTPEMAREVERLFRKGKMKRKKIFAMGGHRDGVISFGQTADEAGFEIMRAALEAFKLRY
jgi:L-ribulose-5-phosphate 4-epimerase